MPFPTHFWVTHFGRQLLQYLAFVYHVCAFLTFSRKKTCAIPGLEGRHFDLLGLFNCSYAACDRENIPATQASENNNYLIFQLTIKRNILKIVSVPCVGYE